MTKKHGYKVSDVARTTGVSVRTLHYYDEIGLLVPTDRTTKGYRLYSEQDVLRLQQILIGRSLGFSLNDIKRSMDDPAFDVAKSLQRQRELLVERLSDTHKIIAAIDETLARLSNRKKKRLDLTKIFDGFDPALYEEEVREKWGETEAYAESARRTKDYSEQEWRAIKDEQADLWKDAARAKEAGEKADSKAAFEIVDRHRRYVTRWFYTLLPDAHVQLANMWEVDQRYADSIDRYGAGLTAWVAAAVRRRYQ